MQTSSFVGAEIYYQFCRGYMCVYYWYNTKFCYLSLLNGVLALTWCLLLLLRAYASQLSSPSPALPRVSCLVGRHDHPDVGQVVLRTKAPMVVVHLVEEAVGV